MRLDTACFVAPKPKVPSMPTRRAFLLAGGMFLSGSMIGVSCGYSAGYAAGKSAAEPKEASAAKAPEFDLSPSGDIELDELRRLAVKAPLDELFERGLLFLSSRVAPYKDDVILWHGVDRMSKEILDNPARRVEPSVGAVIIAQIEGTARPAEPSLRDRVPELRKRLAEARRK